MFTPPFNQVFEVSTHVWEQDKNPKKKDLHGLSLPQGVEVKEQLTVNAHNYFLLENAH